MKICLRSWSCDLACEWCNTWKSHEKHILEVEESSARLYFVSHFVTQAKSKVTRESLYLDVFKCDFYFLHPYYIYPHYPQNCKEAKQIKKKKKTLERFLQHTHHFKESYSFLNENSFVVFSRSPLPLLYLERGFVPKHNSHTFRV